MKILPFPFLHESKRFFSLKALGESSKNHKTDSENLAKSGIIPFRTDKFGYNPGLYLSLYYKFLNPKQDRLFQKPQRQCKAFDIHDFKRTVLFEDKPVGKNMVGEMLKKLLKAAGQPTEWTNHNIRSTCITSLKKAGVEDRAVMNVSGMFFQIGLLLPNTYQ